MARAPNPKPNEISRRAALAGMAAASASPWLLGWPTPAAADNSHGHTATDHRLYLVIPKDVTGEKLCDRLCGFALHTARNRQPSHRYCQEPTRLLIWTTPAQAETVGQDKDVQSIRPFTSDDIEVAGDPKRSAGKVAVQVGPGNWSKRQAAGTYRTRRQIVAQWTHKLARVPAIRIELLPLERDGLILITYFSEECPPEVLALIHQDPQVCHIQWGGPRPFYVAPPKDRVCIGCGMG